MVDILKLINASPEEVARVRKIQNGMDQNLVAQGRTSGAALRCFIDKMKEQHPDVYAQKSAQFFLDRLPSAGERAEAARLLAHKNVDEQALMQNARVTADRLGIGSSDTSASSPHKLAVLDIMENTAGCVSASNVAPTKVASAPRRAPTMSM